MIDLALLTDGLRAEREQGITIDVAYRYFSTPKRKFIIADTPGHEQYTRNMATGASTADLAIILIDARNGVLPQSRRHAFIANLLGIKHFVVAINKMDLVGFDKAVYDAIRRRIHRLPARTSARPNALFIPISARDGDNVVDKSSADPLVLRPGAARFPRRQFPSIEGPGELCPRASPCSTCCGRISISAAMPGSWRRAFFIEGEEVMALPARRRSRIARIVTYDGDLQSAYAPQSVTLCLADEIDISRGDLIVPAAALPHVAPPLPRALRVDERAAARTGPQLLHQAHLASGARRDSQRQLPGGREFARAMWAHRAWN